MESNNSINDGKCTYKLRRGHTLESKLIMHVVIGWQIGIAPPKYHEYCMCYLWDLFGMKLSDDITMSNVCSILNFLSAMNVAFA